MAGGCEVDVSYQAVASGMLETACEAIRASLDDLIAMCDNSIITVGFMTFDSAVHFYQIAVLLSFFHPDWAYQ